MRTKVELRASVEKVGALEATGSVIWKKKYLPENWSRKALSLTKERKTLSNTFSENAAH